MRRRPAANVIAVVALLGLLGCGAGDPDAVERRRVSPEAAGPLTELPTSFRDKPLLATAHHVVRYDRAEIVAIDLRSGAEHVMQWPQVPPGREYLSLASVGLDEELVDVGQTCEPVVDGQDEPPVCDPGYSIHLLDPDTGHWRATELSPSLAALDVTSVALLQALPDGRAVIDLSIDGNQGAVTAVFDGDRWAQVGDPVGRGSGLDCATTTHLVRLLEAPVPAGMTSPGSGIDSVIYRTEMRSLADGTVRELPGPDVDGSFGGAAVTLACGADHAVAASPGPNRSFVLGDEGWKVAEPPSSDDGKPMAPISVWSGSPRPLISWMNPTLAPNTSRTITLTTVDDTGRLHTVESNGDLTNVEVLPLGPSAELLLLGPSQPPTEVETRPEDGRPLPLRRLTVS